MSIPQQRNPELPEMFGGKPRGENRSLYEIKTPSTKEKSMTDTNPVETVASTASEVVDELKPSRFKSFVKNHPRIARAATLTGAGLAIVVATSTAKNMQHNKHKLAEARSHAADALDAVSDSTATPPPAES